MKLTSSATNGFISVLGSLPIQFAMLVTFIAVVPLPKDSEEDVIGIYSGIVIMHFVNSIVVLLS